MVPASSREREGTLRGIPRRSYLPLKASPTMKLVAYWLEVSELVKAVAVREARMVLRRVLAKRKTRSTTVRGMAWM